MKNLIIILFTLFFNLSCSSLNYDKTVSNVDIDRFMGRWYVIAGRFTFLEDGGHNSIEDYRWNEEKERIDIDFFFNKDSFDGEVKRIKQKAWIHNQETKAHWKVSPFWPLKLDYLIIALADDYSWSAIGVPNGKYLWILARNSNFSKAKVSQILEKLKSNGYPIEKITYVPHGKQ